MSPARIFGALAIWVGIQSAFYVAGGAHVDMSAQVTGIALAAAYLLHHIANWHERR